MSLDGPLHSPANKMCEAAWHIRNHISHYILIRGQVLVYRVVCKLKRSIFKLG